MKDAFRRMIEKKAEAEKMKLQHAEDILSKNDLLRTKLKNWEREKRNPAKTARGGEEGDIWNLEIARDEEIAEKERLRMEAEEAKLRKEREINNTINELYKRILKVEKLSAKISDSGIMGTGARRGGEEKSTDKGGQSNFGGSKY